MERIKKLLTMLEQEPNDPFLLYAIALEYLKSKPHKAMQYFEVLLEQHANYLPTYLQAATLFADMGLYEKAKTTFIRGINIATLQSDKLSRRELQNAYSNFLSEDQD